MRVSLFGAAVHHAVFVSSCRSPFARQAGGDDNEDDPTAPGGMVVVDGIEMPAEAIVVEEGKANKAGGRTSCGCSLRSAAA